MLRFASAVDDRSKVVSALAQVEARSAICRIRNANSFTADEASMMIEALSADLRGMIEQPITPPVLETASGLIDRYILRALDAIQLASAIVVRELMAAYDMRFIASDHELLEAAQAEEFAVWNPQDS